MSRGVSDDLPPLCPDCGYRHEPGDHDQCELNQLREGGAAPGVLDPDEQETT